MKVGIVGAGIMGQLLAFSLLRAGWNVTLFDFKKRRNCSESAAGLLMPVAELEKNELIIFKLGLEALNQHWPTVISLLRSQIYFQKQGSLALAHPQDLPELQRTILMIASKLQDNSFYQKLDQQEITALEPQLAKFPQACFFPAEGQLDNQSLLIALTKNLIANEVTWYNHSLVQQVGPGKVYLNDKTYSFDLVLDCRGLGAKDRFNDLRSIRGELIWLHAPEVFIARPIRLMHPRYSLYIAPRPNNQYIIGATEIETEDYSPISLRSTLELLTAIYSVNSTFSEARIIKTVTHCRPVLSNHLPKIKYSDGLFSINGLYRHGFLIAPSLAAEILLGIQKGIASANYAELWEKIA